MSERLTRSGLQVARPLVALIEDEMLPGTGLSPDAVWAGLADLVAELAPRNHALLETRAAMQSRIDAWLGERRGQPIAPAEQADFLQEIGYIAPEGPDFQIGTENVDPELCQVPGPQLVVPLSNPRFALNAANARWGSLYDALYGSDVIDESDGKARGASYNPRRGAAVIAYASGVLDRAVPLAEARHDQVQAYRLVADGESYRLAATLANGSTTGLADPSQLAGFAGAPERPDAILLRRHGLHLEIAIDPSDPIGASVATGVKDVIVEAAVTTIQDCEDSVAAVDAADKTAVYRNWLRLMRGDLTASFTKNGQCVTRQLNPDRHYTAPDGSARVLSGRSAMLVRNVGHLMTTDTVLDSQGAEIPEGILDALVTALAGLHDLKGLGRWRNSPAGSIYIVKPKMHGPEEAAFTDTLFARVEDILGLPRRSLKVGLMDEERRTSVNLKECIRAVADRLVFINTGFLDRTGDEIHTMMEAGPVPPKSAIKNEPWYLAYEARNVDIGLACGLRGRGQIGKGMWPKPDNLAEMMATKSAHLRAGGTCAWVPSPTAATLHALHYHEIDVLGVQAELAQRAPVPATDLFALPLLAETLPAATVASELDNNAQSLLGYVVRWVDQGIGCSKVPDASETALMEDRATLRIGAQHIANWLRHGLVSEAQVLDAMKRMAAVVDRQNAGDANYRAMASDFEASVAFRAACDLVFRGRSEPNGYTEPILHARRREAKAMVS